MNAGEKVALRELLRIRDSGKTLLLIEHDVKLVMGLCDRLTVLDYGKAIAEGEPRRFGVNRRSFRPIWEAARMSEALLSVKQLKVSYGGIHAVKGIDFMVNAGEQVTLIGANGAGKTSSLRALTGLQPFEATSCSTAVRFAACRRTACCNRGW